MKNPKSKGKAGGAGKCWFYNIETLKLKAFSLDEDIPEGWTKGRKHSIQHKE